MTRAGTLPRSPARLLGGLAASALLALSPDSPAGETLLSMPRPVAAAPALPAGVPLALADCQRVALERQPALAAARASLAAAGARAQALENLRVPGFLARDLPVRRQQSARGVLVAEAALRQAEKNTRYAVTYCYLSALYANEQETLAQDSLTRLGELRDLVKQYLDRAKENPDEAGDAADRFNPRDLDRIDAYRATALVGLQEARLGRERALSGLREAMGVGPDCPVSLARRTQFVLDPPVDSRLMVELALARRPELVQAAQGVAVSALEVCAQEARRLPQAPTFASGSDIHAQPLPAGSYDQVYQPGAVGPEMPGTLTGSRAERAGIARIYEARAGAVLDKARGLVALETEQFELRRAEASRKILTLEAGRKAADRALLATRNQVFKFSRYPRLDQLLDAGVLLNRFELQVNENRYRLLVALAGLERATAGGFQAGFDTAPPDVPPRKPDAPAVEEKKDEEKAGAGDKKGDEKKDDDKKAPERDVRK